MKKNNDYTDSNLIFSLIKKEVRKPIPLGFHLVRPIKADRSDDFVTVAESSFHQTNLYGVGGFYKPVAFILDEKELINE